MAHKNSSDCWQVVITEEDTTPKNHGPQDLYNEIMIPFPIKPSLMPIYDVTLETYPTFSLSSELHYKDFPVFSYSSRELAQQSIEILKKITEVSSKHFILIDLLRINYYSFVPFHNFWHAFSVFQMIFVIGERNNSFENFLYNSDYYYLLISALGHDVCHPGLNNYFFVATKHVLAEKSCNVSVLENHHASVLIDLCKKSKIFDESELKVFSKLAIEAILSTDMARHKLTLERFVESLKNYDIESLENRQNFMNTILHCADLGNQTLDFKLAVVWSLKVTREFNFQIGVEESVGVKVSEFMRTGSDIEKIKQSQVGFIKAVILPMWQTLSLYVPGTQEHVKSLKNNKKIWKKIVNFQTIID